MAVLDEDIRALVEARNFAHVATLMPDGSPHSVPVWIGRHEQDRLVFFTQESSQKARNLARDPRLAVSLVDRDNPYRTVRMRGRVVQRLTGEEALAVIDRLAVSYTGEPFPRRTGVGFVVQPARATLLELPFRD